MDIQAEKLSLIEWLAGITDTRIIKQFRALQKSTQEPSETLLTVNEKSAIEAGLKSIKEGRSHTHKTVMESTMKKYPGLFK